MPGPAATISHLHTCPMFSGTVPHVGGPVAGPGVPSVLIVGKPAAVMGDKCVCVGPPDPIIEGVPNVLIGGKPAATIGSMTAHGGMISIGEPTVVIGTASGGGSSASSTGTAVMPLHKIHFPAQSFMDWMRGKNKEALEIQEVIKEYAPLVEIPEDSTEVTLTTTFAQDQLHLIAKKDSLALFLRVFITIFGTDIPVLAFDELYHDAKNKDPILFDPPLVVKKSLPYSGRYAAFYSDDDIIEIWIAEQAIRDAETDNDVRAELMTSLIEEYGHYLDCLLRHHYAETENKDAQGDEGAKYAYRLYSIDPIEQADQHFADACIDGRPVELTWEFNELHNDLKAFVNEDRQAQEDKRDSIEFYKAGYLKPHGEHHTPGEGDYGHGDIEKEALGIVLKVYISEREGIKQTLDTIYLGNWLRDFSQAVDPMLVRPLSNAADGLGKASEDYDENDDMTIAEAIRKNVDPDCLTTQTLPEDHETDVTLPSVTDWGVLPPRLKYEMVSSSFHPVKLSIHALTGVVKLAAVKEFVHAGVDRKKKEIVDYTGHVEYLKEHYIDITPETLGTYRPEEHIDNPKGIGQNDDKGNRGDKQLYGKFVGYVDDANEVHDINSDFGMKNYIRSKKDAFTVDGADFPTSFSYIKTMLTKASTGGLDDAQSLVDFGAALHTLEDYFAHSNYSEVALIKCVQPLVYPWVDGNHKGFVYNYNDIRNRKRYGEHYCVIDPRKIQSTCRTINELASYIPIVTGTFGLVDTAASVMPILNEHFFSLEYKGWEETQYNTRTFGDMMLLEWMGAFDEAQAADGSGTDDSTYLEAFQTLLTIRDYMKYSELLVPDFVEKQFHWLMHHIGNIFKFTQYFVIQSSAATLNDAQVLIDKDLKLMSTGKFEIGTDPSHTQIAKDDTGHPLHNLSAQLAVEAVRQVGEKMMKVWTSGAPIQTVIDVVDRIMRHPSESVWQEPIVLAWAEKHPDKVCDACSPSIVVDRTLHAIEEIDEALNDMRTNVIETDITEKVAAYLEQKTGAEIDEKGLVEFIDESIAVCESQTDRVVGNDEKGIVGIKDLWDDKFPKPANCRIKNVLSDYTIREGDILGEIAIRGNTTVEDILDLNPSLERDTIFPGKVIKVPHPIIEVQPVFKD